MAYPTMPTLTEPLVQQPHVDNLHRSSSHDEFVQTDSVRTVNKETVEKLVQGPVAYKYWNQNPRFKPLPDRDWGAWWVRAGRAKEVEDGGIGPTKKDRCLRVH